MRSKRKKSREYEEFFPFGFWEKCFFDEDYGFQRVLVVFNGCLMVLMFMFMLMVMAVKVHSRRQNACEGSYCGYEGCLNFTLRCWNIACDKKKIITNLVSNMVEYSLLIENNNQRSTLASECSLYLLREKCFWVLKYALLCFKGTFGDGD